MNILIGSRALHHWFPDFKPRTNSDWDIVSESPLEWAEWHNPKTLNNEKLVNYVSHEILINGVRVGVISPKGLALVKRSHLWRDLFFDKHITHYHKYLAGHMKELTEQDVEFLNERTSLTKKEFPQRTPSLNMSKEEFFDDYVTKKYDHDWLHTLVSPNGIPQYTLMKREGDSVWCEKDMWETFTESEKLRCVVEETTVIAIERFMVPNDWKYPAKLAYFNSLKKVCTTLCSGWFRDYAIDHYPQAVSAFDQQVFNKVKGICDEFVEA